MLSSKSKGSFTVSTNGKTARYKWDGAITTTKKKTQRVKCKASLDKLKIEIDADVKVHPDQTIDINGFIIQNGVKTDLSVKKMVIDDKTLDRLMVI